MDKSDVHLTPGAHGGRGGLASAGRRRPAAWRAPLLRPTGQETLGPAVTGYSIPLSLTVPFLWHPGSRFFVGAGPAFATQLVTRSEGVSALKTTDDGLTALIGGAFPRPPAVRSRAPR